MSLTIILIAMFHRAYVRCYQEHVIWNKKQQTFVEIQNDPRRFDVEESQSFEERDSKEDDISGKVLKASYYEEGDLVMFYEDDTRVTGICGEIWNLLADYLNFTLIPVKYNERKFGERLKNGSYSGLLGLLERNETQVILRTGYYSNRDDVLDYTMPVWNTKYQLYIKPEYGYDNRWMITMFTPDTWCALILLFLVITIVGYLLQKDQRPRRKGRKKLKRTNEYFDFMDHVFYTYSMMCGQGYLPQAFYNQNRILSISKSIFAWLIILSFSSNLIHRMTNRTMTPPFTNLETLLNKTKYDVLVFRGSMIYEFVQANIQTSLHRNCDLSNRFRFINEPNEIYENVCHSKKLYAALEPWDKVFVRSKNFCSVRAMGESYYQTWIGFAVPRHFLYKRVFDRSIIKLHEVGLVNALKHRWLHDIRGAKTFTPFKTIDMDQVYLIFIIPFIGVVLSLVILSLENIIFFLSQKKR